MVFFVAGISDKDADGHFVRDAFALFVQRSQRLLKCSQPQALRHIQLSVVDAVLGRGHQLVQRPQQAPDAFGPEETFRLNAHGIRGEKRLALEFLPCMSTILIGAAGEQVILILRIVVFQTFFTVIIRSLALVKDPPMSPHAEPKNDTF